MPLPSHIQHRLLEYYPQASFHLPEAVVFPLLLTFEVIYGDGPEEDPFPDSYPMFVTEAQGWPDKLLVHPMAGNRPHDGETWKCAVDEDGCIWPVEKVEQAIKG